MLLFSQKLCGNWEGETIFRGVLECFATEIVLELRLKRINRNLPAGKIGKGIPIRGNSMCKSTRVWGGLEYPGIIGEFSMAQVEDVCMERWEMSVERKETRGSSVQGNWLSKNNKKQKAKTWFVEFALFRGVNTPIWFQVINDKNWLTKFLSI